MRGGGEETYRGIEITSGEEGGGEERDEEEDYNRRSG